MAHAPPLWSLRSHRLKVAITLMLALYVVVSMRASLSMAIVCMVNTTAFAREEFIDLPSHEEVEDDHAHGLVDGCPLNVDENVTKAIGYNGKLLWPPARQTLLFSANYYGALSTILVSGTLADRFGPKKILIACVSILMLITVLGPTLANTNYWLYYASRVALGMAEGFVAPSVNSLGGKWFPQNEKSSMAALYTSGNQIAAGSSSFIGAHLCKSSLFDGLSIIWIVIFSVVTSDYPTDNRWIREDEKEYLEIGVATKKSKKASIPWRRLFTSPQIYACLLCNFTSAFCVSLCQNYLPLYFKEELFLPLSYNGLFTIVPFTTQLLCKNIHASVADHIKKTGKLSPTATVKLFQSIGTFGSAFALLCLATFPSCHRPWLAVVFLFIYGAVFSCGISGYFTSLLSIAPAYTGTLTSMSMTCGQLASLMTTNTVSFITYMGWPHKWVTIFLMGAGLQIAAGIVFLILGSGEAADWAKLPKTKIPDALASLTKSVSQEDREEEARYETTRLNAVVPKV